MNSQEMIPQERRTGFVKRHWKRLVIGLAVLFVFIIFTVVWVLSIGHIVSGDWSTILPLVFIFLGISVALLTLLFPFSPVDTRELSPLPTSQSVQISSPVVPFLSQPLDKPATVPQSIPPYVSGLNSTNPSIFLNSFSQALQYQDVQNVELHTDIQHFVATCDDSIILPSSDRECSYGWKDIRKFMLGNIYQQASILKLPEDI
jgi:hypothetical protein